MIQTGTVIKKLIITVWKAHPEQRKKTLIKKQQ